MSKWSITFYDKKGGVDLYINGLTYGELQAVGDALRVTRLGALCQWRNESNGNVYPTDGRPARLSPKRKLQAA
jgi:hypothetical protein